MTRIKPRRRRRFNVAVLLALKRMLRKRAMSTKEILFGDAAHARLLRGMNKLGG